MNSLTSKAGFTLLEVVIALAIMTVAFGAILAVQGGAINAATRAKRMNTISMLAKNKMIETEFKIQGKTFDEVPKEAAGTFPSPYEEFGWKTTITKIDFPDFSGMIAQGGENTDINQNVEMVSKAIQNHLNKATRQVTVTVYWGQGTAQSSYDLSTTWVNLNHELSLQGS